MSTTLTDLQQTMDAERRFLEAARARVPEQFIREPLIDSVDILRRVGIDNAVDRPLGYIRLWPQDFIVEEITEDGTLVTIDVASATTEAPAEETKGKTVWLDLVKIGVSTIDATATIVQALGIERTQIATSGIKDKEAITAQRMSIRNIGSYALKDLNAPHFFLKNIRTGSGALSPGALRGNRFTITVRTPDPLPAQTLTKQLEQLKRTGFPNFYALQRFGTPRLISHLLGKLVLQGKWQEVVRTFLTYRGAREVPYFAAIREKFEQDFGNWKKMLPLTDPLPLHFKLERQLLSYLAAHANDFIGALRTTPEQVQLWAYAYASYVFNKKLAALLDSSTTLPATLPLLLSDDPKDWALYQDYLDADGVRMPPAIEPFRQWIQLKKRTTPAMQRFNLHGVHVSEQLVALDFSLGKGAYATAALLNLFTLAQGLPVLEGIPREPVDSKKLLGRASIAPTLERFKEVLAQRAETLEESVGD